MSKTLSVSISDDSFEYLLFEEKPAETILKSNQLNLPREVTPDGLFSEENLKTVFKKLKEDINSECDGLQVVIPYNRATVKKIKIPANTPKDQKKSLIKWEMETVLPNPMKHYKISILSTQKQSDISEIVNVVALEKKLIQNILKASGEFGTELNGIFLDCFSLEKYLKKNGKPDKNSMISKVNTRFIEHHIFSGNDYYLSYLDFLPRDGRDYVETVSEILNNRYKQSMTVLKQTAASEFDKLQVYIYGKNISKEHLAAIQKNVSTELKLLVIDDLNEKINTEKSSTYIEAYGALL